MSNDKSGRLAGKLAIITGSAAGLGQAMTRRFIAEGARVAGLDVNEDANRKLAAELGDAMVALKVDVRDSDDTKRAVDAAVDALGGLDILINNAGVIPSRETVVNTTIDDWDRSMDVSAKGMFLMCKAAIPHMIERRGGNVISLSSIAGLVGMEIRPAYSAAKGAVSMLTKQMAADFGKHNIRVNAIAPSFVITDINREMFDKMKAEGAPWEAALDLHLIRRMGEPEDIAAAAVFLASDEPAWVTGVVLPVDGGYTAR